MAFPPNISESAGSIFTKFSELVDTFVWMITAIFFLRSPNGCCYGNQLILVHNTNILPSLFALAFHNELEYDHLYARANSGDGAYTSSNNLVNLVQ